MNSTTTSAVADASELSEVARKKAIQGQPTLSQTTARVRAQPSLAEVRKAPALPRVVARPVMGQAPTAQSQGVTISLDEAKVILAGLTETLRLADDARNTGWRCTGVDDATFYKGRVLRDRLANFMAFPPQRGGEFPISRDEADVADKILSCSREATASSPNTGAYIALGVIVAGAAVFFALTK